jgi:hypothetical protein
MRVHTRLPLFVGIRYAFSFILNNPPNGQPSPNVLISTGLEECFPWAEPLALKTAFFVKDIVSGKVSMHSLNKLIFTSRGIRPKALHYETQNFARTYIDARTAAYFAEASTCTYVHTQQHLPDTRFTMSSIKDGTLLSGCRMPRTVSELPYANLDYIFLPHGAWYLSLNLAGYYPGTTLEVKSATGFSEVSSLMSVHVCVCVCVRACVRVRVHIA